MEMNFGIRYTALFSAATGLLVLFPRHPLSTEFYCP